MRLNKVRLPARLGFIHAEHEKVSLRSIGSTSARTMAWRSIWRPLPRIPGTMWATEVRPSHFAGPISAAARVVVVQGPVRFEHPGHAGA